MKFLNDRKQSMIQTLLSLEATGAEPRWHLEFCVCCCADRTAVADLQECWLLHQGRQAQL